MRGENAVEVRGLGKRYEIGTARGGYELLTERIAERIKRGGRSPESREFWALRDVEFDVRRGETLGVIGHNGAGKSTLLKVLSRITRPTLGEARLRGRVGALLEIGTGFHLELTGRENVYLNGSILHMSRREIQAKFDEIVEFADIGPFIDTPVKRYSSGMQLRLAFSVAAHLEPEILIVDEVLSVGDMSFQRKCLGRMETVSEEGRTILFVSHNLAAVRGLCDRAVLLSGGRIAATGETGDVIDAYVSDVQAESERSLRDRENRVGDGRLRFTDLRIERNGKPIDSPPTGEDFDVVVSYETAGGKPLRSVNFGVSVTSHGDEKPMISMYSETAGELFESVPPVGEIRCRVRRNPLPAGQYYIDCWCDIDKQMLDALSQAADLTVAGGDYYGSGREQIGHRTVLVEHEWSLTG